LFNERFFGEPVKHLFLEPLFLRVQLMNEKTLKANQNPSKLKELLLLK